MAVEDLVVDNDDVAVLVRARTKDNDGNEGEFTANTRPTAEQVTQAVVLAATDVATRVASDIDPAEDADLLASARRLVAIRAAMLVEMSYFPEQVREGQSSYEALREMFTEGMDALQDTSDLARPERAVVSVPIRGEAAFDPLTGELWP